MYEKVVVPVDGSEISEAVLPYADELARKVGSHLAFIGVCSEQERPFEHLFRMRVSELADRMTCQGFSASSTFVYGHPVDEIIKFSGEIGATLIAMSSHGHSGFHEWSLGGVAEKILLRAPMPLMLVPGRHPEDAQLPTGKFQRILMPLAGSNPEPVALPWVKELAQKTEARFFCCKSCLHPVKSWGL